MHQGSRSHHLPRILIASFAACFTSQLAAQSVAIMTDHYRQGFQLVATQVTTASPISETARNPPDGTYFIRFNGHRWVTNRFTFGRWSDSTMLRPRGEGMILYSPEPWEHRFAGEVPTGLLRVHVTAHNALVGSPVPQHGLLHSTLQFPERIGTRIKTVDPATGEFVELAEFTQTGWQPEEPTLQIGEAVWVEAPESLLWERMFSLNGTGGLPDLIALHPADRNIVRGSSISLTVETKSPNEGHRFQWQRNGINIPGATSPSFNIPSVQPRDVGDYWVIVGDFQQEEVSNLARVTLVSEPYLEFIYPEPGVLGVVARNLGNQLLWLESTINFQDWDLFGLTMMDEGVPIILPPPSGAVFYRLSSEEFASAR